MYLRYLLFRLVCFFSFSFSASFILDCGSSALRAVRRGSFSDAISFLSSVPLAPLVPSTIFIAYSMFSVVINRNINGHRNNRPERGEMRRGNLRVQFRLAKVNDHRYRDCCRVDFSFLLFLAHLLLNLRPSAFHL